MAPTVCMVTLTWVPELVWVPAYETVGGDVRRKPNDQPAISATAPANSTPSTLARAQTGQSFLVGKSDKCPPFGVSRHVRTIDPGSERFGRLPVALANGSGSYVATGMAVKHRHRGTRPAQVGTLLAGLALAAGACGSSSTSGPARSTSSPTTHVSSAPAGRAPTVLLERGTPVGTVLVDAAGHWLYLNHADTAGGVGSFTCSGSCLRSWHPLLLPPADLAPVVPRALAGEFAVVQRPGGGQQVAFSGAPLYRWVGAGKPVTTGGWAPAVVPATSGGSG
ncbi:hypothetical protein GHK86_16215, partial [Acidimicrobiaceae bacterium USS-CC1]|nr:hypothetical protein [Acidiferrimicrobium australe]